MESEPSSPWAAPRLVRDLQECDFYHTMDIPSYGLVGGDWDLRADTDAYWGRLDLRGKRVLDLGPASGYLTFEMEKRGASLVALDLPNGMDWDFVPYGGEDLATMKNSFAQHIERIKNGFWLAYGANRSKARVAYGNIYRIPPHVGPVDMALFGCILLHLRDPLGALASAAPLVKERLVITEPDWFPNDALVRVMSQGLRQGTTRVRWASRLAWPLLSRLLPPLARSLRDHLPLQYLVPSAQNKVNSTWWSFAPQTLAEFLRVLGFAKVSTVLHLKLYKGKPMNMFTLVGER